MKKPCQRALARWITTDSSGRNFPPAKAWLFVAKVPNFSEHRLFLPCNPAVRRTVSDQEEKHRDNTATDIKTSRHRHNLIATTSVIVVENLAVLKSGESDSEVLSVLWLYYVPGARGF